MTCRTALSAWILIAIMITAGSAADKHTVRIEKIGDLPPNNLPLAPSLVTADTCFVSQNGEITMRINFAVMISSLALATACTKAEEKAAPDAQLSPANTAQQKAEEAPPPAPEAPEAAEADAATDEHVHSVACACEFGKACANMIEVDGNYIPLAFRFTMAELMNAIDEDREPLTSGRDNLKSISIVFALMKSIESGQPVSPAEIQNPLPVTR